jgi:hypothetical protein
MNDLLVSAIILIEFMEFFRAWENNSIELRNKLVGKFIICVILLLNLKLCTNHF